MVAKRAAKPGFSSNRTAVRNDAASSGDMNVASIRSDIDIQRSRRKPRKRNGLCHFTRRERAARFNPKQTRSHRRCMPYDDSYLLVRLLVYLTRNSLISFGTVASPFRTSWPSAPLTRIGSVLMTLE